MRRVFIDLIGRIPTIEEIADFERDRAANKRVRLVQRLLNEKKYTPKGANGRPVSDVPGLKKVPIDYSSQYATNFAELWSVWLLTRSGVDDIYREQFQVWLEEELDKNVAVPRLRHRAHHRVGQEQRERGHPLHLPPPRRPAPGGHEGAAGGPRALR